MSVPADGKGEKEESARAGGQPDNGSLSLAGPTAVNTAPRWRTALVSLLQRDASIDSARQLHPLLGDHRRQGILSTSR